MYKLHISPNSPSKNFWSFMVYDPQTRSMLQTDHQFPRINSAGDVEKHGDGSVDIYFGPCNQAFFIPHPSVNLAFFGDQP
jgi:hypothetical protein